MPHVRVLTNSLTYAYAKCEKKSSLMFNPMTLFSKQFFFLMNQNPLDKPPMFIFLVKSVCLCICGSQISRFSPQDVARLPNIFTGFHHRLSCLTVTTGFFTRWGIYPFLLCPTHVFFMLCNHETHFGRCLITKLTTHSPRMMNDHNHAHTPNTMRCPRAYARQKC